MGENRGPVRPEDDDSVYSHEESPDKGLEELEEQLKQEREKKIEGFQIDIADDHLTGPDDGVDFFPDEDADKLDELHSRSEAFEREQKAPARRAEKKKKLRRKKKNGCLNKLIYFTVICLVALAISQVVIAGAYDLLGVNKEAKEAVIQIEPTTTDDEIVSQLAQTGAVKQPWFFKLYAKLTKAKYNPGTYTIETDMDYEAIINALQSNAFRTDTVKLTFIEGETVTQIAQKLEAASVCSADDFIAAVNEYDITAGNKLIKAIPNADERAFRLEGYLFPDTYDFYLYENAKTAVKRFLNNIYTQRITAEMYERAEKLGMTMDQVLILASMVQKEAGSKEDMYLVSSVFHNRLKVPETFPKLQSDPTTYYEQSLDAKYAGLYDTYVHDGLPAGPICNPGLDAINAVLYPKSSKYYYFVSDVNGKIYYAATLAQHEKNVATAQAVQPAVSSEASSETSEP